jgi:hypothetical protein
MDTIKEISKWLMPTCITGCTVRTIYCLIKSSFSEDECAMYQKRAKNAVKFAILAALVEAVKQLAEAYFNGGSSI